jgi:hypothetical protein
MNPIVIIILTKMCEFAGYDYTEFTWQDDKHIKSYYKTPEGEQLFTDWFVNYMYGLKISELRKITDFPYTLYRRKKQCKKFVTMFMFNYGFCSYKISITEIRKEKLKKLRND